jgi:four helix bundle protein
MTPDELKTRTKKFALDAIRLSNDLPTSRAGNIIANQLIRSSTSVGANYRSACRARTTADFASRIGITLEEADESVYWMELIGESGMKAGEHLPMLMQEGRELVAIFTASHQTTRKKLAAQKSNLKSKI